MCVYSLRGNELGAAGAGALAEALKLNAVLTALNLEYNQLDNAVKQSVCDAVAGRDGFVLKL